MAMFTVTYEKRISATRYAVVTSVVDADTENDACDAVQSSDTNIVSIRQPIRHPVGTVVTLSTVEFSF